MEPALQNHVFGRLWEQATGNGFNRRIERAHNSQGRRAIKFRTDGLHKALILEADHRPGFAVRLCGFPEKPGLVSDEGIVSFAGTVETTSLEALLRQIDQWALSFETLFGGIVAQRNAASPAPQPALSTSDLSGTEATDESHVAASDASKDDWDSTGATENQR